MWVPPSGPPRRLAFLVLVDSVETGLFLTVSALFLTRVAGLPVSRAALGLSFAGSPRAWPRFRSEWRATGSVFVGCGRCCSSSSRSRSPFTPSYGHFLRCSRSWSSWRWPRSPPSAAPTSPASRAPISGYEAVTNVGFAVGAAGAGVVLQVDVPAGYMALLLVNSASFAAGVVVLLTMPDVAASSRSIVLTDRRYLLVCVLITYYALPTVALPLWIVHRTEAPAWTIGALTILNTVLVVLLQVRASRGSETVPGAARRDPPFGRAAGGVPAVRRQRARGRARRQRRGVHLRRDAALGGARTSSTPTWSIASRNT
ncbi:hypothetical protein [Actinophytocola sp. NPDC049390]|uniref:hypothetical protein n=1 Tax=Actinophytocola sp. NPDC049390 TaxID=3363894 RepID=UPI003787F614